VRCTTVGRYVLINRFAVREVDYHAADQFVVVVVEVEDARAGSFRLGVFVPVSEPAALKLFDQPSRTRGCRSDRPNISAVFLPNMQDLHERPAVSLLRPTHRNGRETGGIDFEIKGKLLQLAGVEVMRVSRIE
jgi:hypothetical protein